MKERLTGAIILVVLIVLLVPELLSGPKGPAATAPAGAASTFSEEPPLRSYTINLGDEHRSPQRRTARQRRSGDAAAEVNEPETSAACPVDRADTDARRRPSSASSDDTALPRARLAESLAPHARNPRASADTQTVAYASIARPPHAPKPPAAAQAAGNARAPSKASAPTVAANASQTARAEAAQNAPPEARSAQPHGPTASRAAGWCSWGSSPAARERRAAGAGNEGERLQGGRVGRHESANANCIGCGLDRRRTVPRRRICRPA